MANITGVDNSYLLNSLFGSSATSGYTGYINTSTEKFKGNVTGYKPIQKNTDNTSTTGLSGDDTKSYMAALKEFGSKLKSATANLSPSGQSIFTKLAGSSSNDEALSVGVANQADATKWKNASGTMNVTIEQLATTQKNTGASLNATSISGVTTGTNQFTLEKDGKTYDFSVNINATDSNRTAQQKVADAINKQNTGVTASVQYDDKTKKSSLVLTSKDTGESNAFTITDKEGKGNLVSKLGVGQATQEARDAKYTVNGTEKTSSKNTVDLGNGLTGTLKKTTSEEVAVSAKKDVTGIMNAVYDMVNNFNGLRETTKENSNDKGANTLMKKLDSLSSVYSSSLSRIGITTNKDGYLQVDSDKLKKAFEDGSAERYLGNNNAGFTQRLSQLASQVDSDPNRYVSYQSRNNMNATTTTANDYTNYLSAYQSAQYANIGLLLNTMV